MKTYQPTEILLCPHCHKAQEGPADEYVIPGRVGKSSSAVEQCWECGEEFIAERTSDGTISVASVFH